MDMKRGLFIVFEGPDRSGKTTQINLLRAWLKARRVPHALTREPGGTALSESVRSILLDPRSRISPLAELLLYEAARAQHVGEIIAPALKAGRTVVSDRFTLATVAYQGYGRGLGAALADRLNDAATGGLRPDITFVFTMPDSEFARRSKGFRADRMEREKAAFRRKVNRAYRLLARRPGCVRVDATDTVENIHAAITAAIGRRLERRS